MRIKGISTTKPSPLLRNSIAIRTCADEAPQAPGVIEVDTVAHCGPTLIGEFTRTLTMTDLVTGWTENHSIRNNSSKWIMEGIEELQGWFPFAMVIFDSDLRFRVHQSRRRRLAAGPRHRPDPLAAL